MFKKLATSFLLASALVGGIVSPTFAADETTFQSVVMFPVRLLGSGVGAVIGVPLGIFKDSVKGFGMAADWTADAVGDKDNKVSQTVGWIVGGPIGAAGGGVYGAFDGMWHGMSTGYEKPFSSDSFTYKDE
ncbi:MAG: hypothetical protein U0105_17150 [Candidatus Obscuribacterales bacterium]